MGICQETKVRRLFEVRLLRTWMSACVITLLATATCFASTVTLQWNANTETNLAGYRVYYRADSSALPFAGTGATQGASPINVAKNTSATISGLDPGRAYYFAITAYNTAGLESPYSNIVSVAELTPPTVSITYPGSNATASGTVSVTAGASDNVGVTRVEFYVNGVLKGTDTSTPYLYSWNTTTLASGAYTLSAKAYDAAGNVGSSGNVSVTVVNDATAPTVSLTAPVNNATVSGTVSITANASDNVGVTKVEYYRDGVLLSAGNVPPYGYSWNSASVANGSHILMAKAYDNAGNVAQSANVSVTVNNVVADSTKPTVSVTAPANGATVSGTASVSASATDNVGVTKVEFYLNGALKSTDSASPYSFSWNTASGANGAYTLSAKAYDAAGNVGQSANTSVTVNNSTTPPSGSITAVFGNAAGSTYTNTIEDTFLNINNDVNATGTALNTYTWPAYKPANAILMKWVLSSLPAGAQIQSATLSLYLTGSGGDTQYEMPVSAVINKTPVLSKSNGNTYDGVNSWSPSSVPYGGVPLAHSDIAAAADAPLVDKTIGYKSWNVTDIVQNWVTTPANNKGLLVDSSSKATADSYRVFASSEATDATKRPKLVVIYTLTAASDTTAPAASITAPTTGATVSGTATVNVSATDNVGVSKVEFYINGLLKGTDTAAPYSFSWDTTSVTNGSYTLSAKAYDAAGNVGQSANVSATVNNADVTNPAVSVTAPASSATVSGTAAVSASATDNVGVTKVEFYLNGALKSTDTAFPYSFSWNTASVANGAHTLSAKAYDAAGNVGQSAGVTVTVANTITYTAVFGNATGSTYVNTIEDTFLNINNDVNATGTALNTYTWPAYKPANAILMKWVLSSLPAGAQIQSATLSLYLTGSGGDAQYEMPVSAVINKAPVVTKSNGNTYDGVNSWSPSSVPYGGVPLAQSDIAAAVDAPLIDKTLGYKSWNVTNIVKNWVATPADNKGLLVDSSSKATADSYRMFASSEATDATKRPKLVVTYTLASAQDTTAPAASITAPTTGATVSGTATVNVSATDNVGVSKVEFYINGLLKGTDTAAPYSFSWDTTSVTNGSYTLSAKAYDAAGNVGQSAGVTVTVANTITYTAVFGNATGSTYMNTIEDTFLNINNDVNATGTALNTYTWPAYKPANAILMKWALSSLPANAQIQSATLSLYLTGSGGDTQYEMPVSAVINKTPVLSKSNGNTYDGVNSWSPSSVPYGGVPLAQSDIAAAADAPLIDRTIGYKNWNVTNIVKNWVATPANNKGLLVDSSSKATADSYRMFASSEATDSTKRPKLVVTYVLN